MLINSCTVVKLFHAAIRYAANRMAYKVSDGGSRRIRKEVGKAGKGAYHVFDYETQEAVIMAPEGVMVGIREFVEGKGKENCYGNDTTGKKV